MAIHPQRPCYWTIRIDWGQAMIGNGIDAQWREKAILTQQWFQTCLELAVGAALVLGPATCGTDAGQGSWIFRRGTFTHDPVTGARVAQYARTPPVEPLGDQRAVTSRYRYSRTNLRGADGSLDTYYQVQRWGNGRGGLDAEWERFHDAWKESYLRGGYYDQQPDGRWGYGGYPGAGPWWPGYGYGAPAYGLPGLGYGWPGYGYGWPGYRPPGPDYRHPPGDRP